MLPLARFSVDGVEPPTKGSMKPLPNWRTGKFRVRDEHKAELDSFALLLATAAAKARVRPYPAHHPMLVQLLFGLPRPKRHVGVRGVKPWAKWLRPTAKLDVDKLLRGICDGLVAQGALPDDGQVTDALPRKVYADNRLGGLGVTVTLVPLEEGPTCMHCGCSEFSPCLGGCGWTTPICCSTCSRPLR